MAPQPQRPCGHFGCGGDGGGGDGDDGDAAVVVVAVVADVMVMVVEKMVAVVEVVVALVVAVVVDVGRSLKWTSTQRWSWRLTTTAQHCRDLLVQHSSSQAKSSSHY